MVYSDDLPAALDCLLSDLISVQRLAMQQGENEISKIVGVCSISLFDHIVKAQAPKGRANDTVHRL